MKLLKWTWYSEFSKDMCCRWVGKRKAKLKDESSNVMVSFLIGDWLNDWFFEFSRAFYWEFVLSFSLFS